MVGWLLWCRQITGKAISGRSCSHPDNKQQLKSPGNCYLPGPENPPKYVSKELPVSHYQWETDVMLIGTNRASLRGSGWHHSCFTQQGFPSLPAEDNHQKILGQSSGIILTPPVKEREKSWSKNKSDSVAFFIFAVGPAGRVAGRSLTVKTRPLFRVAPSHPSPSAEVSNQWPEFCADHTLLFPYCVITFCSDNT